MSDSVVTTWRNHRQQQRELRRQDRCSAAKAEAFAVDEVLAGAVRTIDAGWVQHAWFAWDDESGRRHLVTERNLADLGGRDVSATCLVGAIVHAAGGPTMAGSQLVHRTLGVVWHALHRRPDDRMDWSPPPAVRAARIRDLTIWNDRPERDRHDVEALLTCARGLTALRPADASAADNSPADSRSHTVPAHPAS
jgi:hypothetical protein